MDTLTVKGVGTFDGEYQCDIVGMLTVTSDEALTNDESHLVKRLSGMRRNEVPEAFLAGDTDVVMALTIIVLSRHGKQIDERILGPKPSGCTVFAFGEDAVIEVPPTQESETKEDSLSKNGGSSSSLTLAPQPPDRDRIGVPA